MTAKEIHDKNINFRATTKMYEDIMKYLKNTGETISTLMRHMTYDYLRFKKAIQETEEPKKEKPERNELEVEYHGSEKVKYDD